MKRLVTGSTYTPLDPFFFYSLTSAVSFLFACVYQYPFTSYYLAEAAISFSVYLITSPRVSRLFLDLYARLSTTSSSSRIKNLFLFLSVTLLILAYNSLSSRLGLSNSDRMIAAKQFKVLWIFSFMYPAIYASLFLYSIRSRKVSWLCLITGFVFLTAFGSLSVSALAYPILVLLFCFISAYRSDNFLKSWSLKRKMHVLKSWRVKKSLLLIAFVISIVCTILFFVISYFFAILGRDSAELLQRLTVSAVGIYSTLSETRLQEYVQEQSLWGYLLHPFLAVFGMRGYEYPLGVGIRDAVSLNGAVAGVGSLGFAYFRNQFLGYLLFVSLAVFFICFLRTTMHRILTSFVSRGRLDSVACMSLLIMCDLGLCASFMSEYSNLTFYLVGVPMLALIHYSMSNKQTRFASSELVSRDV
jgi:hypothetical protein